MKTVLLFFDQMCCGQAQVAACFVVVADIYWTLIVTVVLIVLFLRLMTLYIDNQCSLVPVALLLCYFVGEQ